MTGHKLYDPEETEGSVTLFGKCTEKFKIIFFIQDDRNWTQLIFLSSNTVN